MVILNETIENGRKTDVMEMRKVMFEKGEYIVYGTSGVCEVTDIKNMDLKGIPKDIAKKRTEELLERYCCPP